MKRSPVVVDPRRAELAKVDGEIEHLERQIAEKRAAVDADQKLHPLDQSQELQDRLNAQIRVLRGHVDQKQKERFDVELGDLADTKRQAAAVAPAKQHRAWELKPVQEPEYPDIARTAENQKAFSEAFERLRNYAIYKKYLGLKEAGCHPDQLVDLDLVATIAAQSDAGYLWTSHRIKALEERLAEIEARPSMAYRGVWDRGVEYHRGDVTTHQGSSWHCELDAATGLQPGEGLGWKLMVKKGRDARS